MATLIESYAASRTNFESSLQTALPGPQQVWQQQEILYRIEVLEVCQMFCKTAPRSINPQDLLLHYQMVDAYFQNLITERRYGVCLDEKLKPQRETAHGSLLKVVQDYRTQFGSFAPGEDVECYRKTIANVIRTILPVWTKYRQMYIEVPKEASNEQH
jgi:hypothetical protein